MGLDVVVEDPGHLGVEPRHEPLGPLDHGRPQPPRPEGLGELQPDVAAADDDRVGAALLQVGDDPVHVGDVAQHVDARVVGTRDRWPHRFGPRTQHERVVRLPVRAAVVQVADLDLFRVAVDAEHVLAGPHVEREALGEALGRLQQQALAVRDLAADVVRQTAVRERHEVATLEHDDLGGFIQPPEAGPRRGTRRHSAHDHRLHLVLRPSGHTATFLFYVACSRRGITRRG